MIKKAGKKAKTEKLTFETVLSIRAWQYLTLTYELRTHVYVAVLPQFSILVLF
jgi:hypothetical protein